MARWIEEPDPASQQASRAVPVSTGIIAERTAVGVPSTLFARLQGVPLEVQDAFDLLAMRMSRIFANWKGTRWDFRFTDNDLLRVLSLRPMPGLGSIRVEIRTDRTGYDAPNEFFPEIIQPSSDYPGEWSRGHLAEIEGAVAMARDLEVALRAPDTLI